MGFFFRQRFIFLRNRFWERSLRSSQIGEAQKKSGAPLRIVPCAPSLYQVQEDLLPEAGFQL